MITRVYIKSSMGIALGTSYHNCFGTLLCFELQVDCERVAIFSRYNQDVYGKTKYWSPCWNTQVLEAQTAVRVYNAIVQSN